MAEIGLDDYKKLGLASSKKALIKMLGSGELKKAITDPRAQVFQVGCREDRKGRRQSPGGWRRDSASGGLKKP